MIAPMNDAELKLQNACQKTKVCMFYLLGACTKKSSCKFAHSDEELKSCPDLSYTKMCRAAGSCKNPTCKFAHERSELRKVSLPNMMCQPAGSCKSDATKDIITPMCILEDSEYSPRVTPKVLSKVATPVCKFFRSGTCDRPDFCDFAYNVEDWPSGNSENSPGNIPEKSEYSRSVSPKNSPRGSSITSSTTMPDALDKFDEQDLDQMFDTSIPDMEFVVKNTFITFEEPVVNKMQRSKSWAHLIRDVPKCNDFVNLPGGRYNEQMLQAFALDDETGRAPQLLLGLQPLSHKKRCTVS